MSGSSTARERYERAPTVRSDCNCPLVNELPEDLRSQWFKEQAAAKAKQEKQRKRAEAEERRRREKEWPAAEERADAGKGAGNAHQGGAGPSSLASRARGSFGRRLLARIVHVLDPKFERYITPEIIRLVWGLSLLLGFLGVSIYALGGLQAALPRRASLANVRPEVVLRREAIIGVLIEEKEFERSLAQVRSRETPETRERPQVAVDEKPALDWVKIHEEYERMGIEELRAAMGKLEKEYPSYRTKWLFRHTFLYPLWVAAGLAATVLGLLMIRVLCESLCVVFNIAIHLDELRKSLSVTTREQPT